jgi:hypothetical protein
MRSEYDFSQSRKNPYANQLKRQITIRLDITAVNYFKELAAERGCLIKTSSICSCGTAPCGNGALSFNGPGNRRSGQLAAEHVSRANTLGHPRLGTP